MKFAYYAPPFDVTPLSFFSPKVAFLRRHGVEEKFDAMGVQGEEKLCLSFTPSHFRWFDAKYHSELFDIPFGGFSQFLSQKPFSRSPLMVGCTRTPPPVTLVRCRISFRVV